ncbi:hypothetical protein F6X53_06160 [Methylobacterium soli]|uniref:Porin n=1 Tax=Methylobacterium soli TaxID=553447 RepID=A0A6L3T513_9HYPH|nr:hypothetical protein F6X53_06160 [Methylobacterium soli]
MLSLLVAGVPALASGARAADVPDSKISDSKIPAPKTLPPEAAAANTDIGWAFSARVVSDYNFFGITYSNHQPAVQAYGELQFFDNFAYVAAAVSSTYLPTLPSPPIEFDVSGGFRPKFGDLTADIGVIGFLYLGERRLVVDNVIWTPASYNSVLAYTKLSYPIGDFVLGANTYYSPNIGGAGVQMNYTAGLLRYNIPENALGFLPAGLSVSGEFGRYSFLNRSDSRVFYDFKYPSFNYGNVGISYNFDKFTLDLRFHKTDLSKSDCFVATTDPRGVYSGSGRSNWCGSAIIGSLQFDISSAGAGVFDSPKPLETAPPR